MAVSVNGLTKKTDTEVTASDITTSDVALISDKVDKLVDQIQKALKFNNNSEKDKKELNATLKDILKQQEQIQDYQETREKLLKRSKNLTKEQREAILADLDEEVLKIFKNFSSLDEELKDTSLIMASKLGVGKNFNKTFTEILETTKRIEKTAKVNQNIRSRNESIDSARKKIGETVGEGVSNSLGTMLYNSLGPLRIFTDPIFKGKTGFFSATSTLFTALGKKVNSSTKTELESKGGTIGKSAVYIGEKLDEVREERGGSKSEEGDSSFLDGLLDGVKNGFVIKSFLPALPTTFTLGGIASSLLKGGFLAVSLWGIADTIESYLTKDYEQLEENAYEAGYKDALNDIDLFNNSFIKYFGDFPEILAGAIADAQSGENFFSALMKRSGERTSAYDKGITVAGLEKYAEETGVSYDELREEYNSDLMLTKLNRDWNSFWEKWANQSGVLSGTVGTPQFIYTEEEIEEIKTQAETPPSVFGSNEPMVIWENGIPKPNPDYVSPLDSMFTITPGSFGAPKITPFDDAIIYKDNSVYVPHPDDNIVLTKDEVSTPVLSGNFEGTLLDILRTIATNTKGSGNVYAVNSTPEFDFSMLRV